MIKLNVFFDNNFDQYISNAISAKFSEVDLNINEMITNRLYEEDLKIKKEINNHFNNYIDKNKMRIEQLFEKSKKRYWWLFWT